MRRLLIFLIVFWSGFFVMAVELLSARLIAPHFGSSIYVWGAIITVFMLGLAAGYWCGGMLSLTRPSLRKLAAILCLAAIATIPAVLAADGVMTWLFALIQDPRYGALAAAALLFFAPTAVSGMVSPYAVRLLVDENRRSGQHAGRLYCAATVGSAAGTIVTSFYWVLYWEVNHILWALIAVSLLIGAGGLAPKGVADAPEV